MPLLPKVSILVPIYNVEQYLEQCLESLVGQTLQDIEIICINDGSTDRSSDILGRFAAADPRIKVIDKPNSGYGASMNRGLDAAQGAYIGIVESDDYAEPDMFESLYAAAVGHDVPVVRGEYFFTWTGPDAREHRRAQYREVGADYHRVLDPAVDTEVFRAPPAIWSGIYRKSLIDRHGIRFLESPGASFQDTGFIYKILMAADALYLLEKPFLHYRQDNAASSVKATAKIYTVVGELQSSLDFLDRFPERRGTLRLVMQGIAYQTFRWNIIRIAKEHRREFCEFMHEWFSAALAAGELDPAYFAKGLYEELDILLADHGRYLRLVNSPINELLSRQGKDVHFSFGSLLDSLGRAVSRRLGTPGNQRDT